MKLFKIFFFLLLLCLVSSCAFNKTFHHAQRLPYSIEKMPSFSINSDTTFIHYDKMNQEISFSKPKNKIVNQNYSIKNLFFKSSSGNRLNGWFLTPKNTTPIATILHFHGSASNLLMQYESINPLIEYGFQVFTFDYSGYGYSEGKPTRKNALKDAYAALEFVINNHKKKETPLLIYGHSYGGYLASVVGSNQQNNIDGIVVEGAFSSHKEEAKFTAGFFGNLVKNEAIAHQEISKNKKPLLIIHSTEDKRVPLKFGEKIFEHANHPKEFYEIDKAHILGLQYYSEEIANKIKAMLSIEN